jgi:AcrR family transcriptional regulator
MATEETRSCILAAAEQLFAEHGYAGASVRKITALAGVDLGAVRYHFGSKDALFGEVLQRRLEPLCRRRLELLDELERRWGRRAPPVEEIIRVFLEPALTLLSDEDHGRYWVKLLGRVRIEPGEYLVGVQLPYQTLLERFLACFARALPELPEDDLAYRFYFSFGTEINTLIDDGTLRAMRPGLPNVYEDSAAVMDRLVRFCAAGMRGSLPPPSGQGAENEKAGAHSAEESGSSGGSYF